MIVDFSPGRTERECLTEKSSRPAVLPLAKKIQPRTDIAGVESGSPHQCVVDDQHDNGADDRDKHRVQVKSGDALAAQSAEDRAADQRAEDAERDVPNAAFATAVYDVAGDEPGDETEHDPTENRRSAFPHGLLAESISEEQRPQRGTSVFDTAAAGDQICAK